MLDPSPVLTGPVAPAAPSKGRPTVSRPSDAVRARRIGAALRMLGVITASYAVDAVLLGLFAAVGTVSPALPLAFGAAALAICACFFVLLRSGLSQHARDPNLTIAQMGAATSLQLACMAYAPHLAFVFFNVLFIIF